jgi:hypothetical protein
MKKYGSLIEEIQKHSYKKVSFVDIMRRNDVGDFFNSRRIAINLQMKELCERNEFGFVVTDVVGEDLDWMGLHLNNMGQDKVARVIFKHCKTYLN